MSQATNHPKHDDDMFSCRDALRIAQSERKEALQQAALDRSRLETALLQLRATLRRELRTKQHEVGLVCAQRWTEEQLALIQAANDGAAAADAAAADAAAADAAWAAPDYPRSPDYSPRSPCYSPGSPSGERGAEDPAEADAEALAASAEAAAAAAKALHDAADPDAPPDPEIEGDVVLMERWPVLFRAHVLTMQMPGTNDDNLHERVDSTLKGLKEAMRQADSLHKKQKTAEGNQLGLVANKHRKALEALEEEWGPLLELYPETTDEAERVDAAAPAAALALLKLNGLPRGVRQDVNRAPRGVTHIFRFVGFFFTHFKGKTDLLTNGAISYLEDLRDDAFGGQASVTCTDTLWEWERERLRLKLESRIEAARNLAHGKRKR